MAEPDLTLWGIGTPRTMRAHWMLTEFGLDYDLRPITSRSGETMTREFLALNPKHKIPVLCHGSFVLSESAAIIAYVGEEFAAPDGFFVPTDATARARLNEWCYFIMTELDALSLYVIRKHLDLPEIFGEAPGAVTAARDCFSEQTSALFAGFARDREHLMPEGMSVADILLVTCIQSAYRRGITVPDCLTGYNERMIERPAYRTALERNTPPRAPGAGR